MPPKKSNDISEQVEELKRVVLMRLDSIDANMKQLNETILETKKMANDALNLACTNEANINKNNDNLLIKIEKLEEQLEDQTNRSMRTTLVFKGIPGTERSLDQTSEVLSNKINEMCNKEVDISDWVERAHRSKANESENKTKINIIAKFCSWRQSESIKKIVVDFNKNEPDISKHIYVEQLQSKKLTERTNNAKKRRKDLKQEHPDWKMFITYPAKLMCKKPGDSKYRVLDEF